VLRGPVGAAGRYKLWLWPALSRAEAQFCAPPIYLSLWAILVLKTAEISIMSAAATLSQGKARASPSTNTLRNKGGGGKKIVFKPYLTSPYHVAMEAPPSEAVADLCREFRQTYGWLKVPVRQRRERGRQLSGNVARQEEADVIEPAVKRTKRTVVVAEEAVAVAKPRANHALVIGLNAVTRSLEQDRLCAVLVAKEACPPILTRHLPALAHVRDVPLCVLPGLGGLVQDTLGLPARVAIGVRRQQDTVDASAFVHLVTMHALRLSSSYMAALRPADGNSDPSAATALTYLPLRVTHVNATSKKPLSTDKAKQK